MEIKHYLLKIPLYFLLFLLLFGAKQPLLCQGYTSSKNYTGFWETPETWTPTWTSPRTIKISQNITIQGYIKTAGDLSFDKGKLTVLDTLIIAGYLKIGEDTQIILKENAILIVLGSVIVADDDGKIKVGAGAYFVIGGDFLVTKGEDLDEFSSKDSPPKIFIEGDIRPSKIKDDDNDYASLNCKNAQNPYLNSGCTYGNFVDFAADPLYSFYQSLINGDPPTITTQPSDVDVCDGSDVVFTVEAANAGSYQWQVDDGNGFVDLVNDAFIQGSRNNQLRIKNATTLRNDHLYRCRISNSNDVSVTSAPALLTIEAAVTAFAGSDVTICENSSYSIDDSEVINGNGVYQWTTCVGEGQIFGVTQLSPTYTASKNDADKTVVLALKAWGKADCLPHIDSIRINVEAAVTVSAGADVSICESSSHSLSGASVDQENCVYEWSTTGEGIFTDKTILQPTYTPSVSDAGKSIILRLTAWRSEVCAPSISEMNINVDEQVVAYAGRDAIICEKGSYYIADSEVSNGNGTYLWEHNGNGEIDDNTALNPTYTATSSDAGKTVTLTLTAQGIADCPPSTDQMKISIVAAVKVKAGADVSICEQKSHTVNGASVSYSNGDYLWTHNGDGTLSDPTTLSPTYTSVPSDAGKIVVLTLSAQGNPGCPPGTDDMTITVVKQVSASAGVDTLICEKSSHTIDGATVANGNGIYLWTYKGEGSITGRTSLTPTFSPQELNVNQLVTLTLTAYGNANCSSAISNKTIEVEAQVDAYAGNDVSICRNSSYKVADAKVENGNGIVSWSHNGKGELIEDNTLEPTYIPDPLDVGQTVILTLKAEGNADCSPSHSEMTISVVEQVVVLYAGNDATICQNSEHKVEGVLVQYGNGIVSWSHNGQGELTGEETLSPTYIPDPLDADKIVTLTLTAEGNGDCSPATGEMKITVEAQVTVYAGNEGFICENDSHKVIGAKVEHGNEVYSWSHDGQGALREEITLTPTYTPDALDAGQLVTLTLTAEGYNVCAPTTAHTTLRVDKQATGSVGSDDAVCGTTYLLYGAKDGGTGLWSQANGSGEAKFLPNNGVEAPQVEVSVPGEYIFNWTVSNGQCRDESTVSINFKEIPNAAIEAEANVCGLEQSIVALPNKGTGSWQLVSGSEDAFFEEENEKKNNKIKVSEIGIYEVSWIANLNGCLDTAYYTISFNPVPKVNAGSNKEVFYNREVVLGATLENGETGYWEIEKGSGLFEDRSLPSSKVTNLDIGENIFEWIVSNGLCESKNRVFIEVVDAQIPNIITPNRDKNKFFVIKDIENIGPVRIVVLNRWGNKVYESTNYDNKWDGRDLSGKVLLNDTYYYYVEFANKKITKGYVLIQR